MVVCTTGSFANLRSVFIAFTSSRGETFLKSCMQFELLLISESAEEILKYDNLNENNQLIAIEQYLYVVLFIMLYTEVILNVESFQIILSNSACWSCQYYEVVLAFDSADEIIKCRNLIESY